MLLWSRSQKFIDLPKIRQNVLSPAGKKALIEVYYLLPGDKDLQKITEPEPVKEGHGKRGFIVIAAQKSA
jgi:hypothetical protein